MSIKHIEDLSYRDFISNIGFFWEVTEKVDGSSAKFHIENGVFSLSCAGQRYFSISDIPNEAWASSYRLGFIAGSVLLNSIQQSTELKNMTLVVELLFNKRPNSIFYDISDTIVILEAIIDDRVVKSSSIIPSFITNGMVISFKELFSSDGVNLEEQLTTTLVQVINNTRNNVLSKTIASSSCPIYKKLTEWLATPSEYPDMTISDVVVWPMNLRPAGYSVSEWKEAKSDFKNKRDEYRCCLDQMRLELKSHIINSVNAQGSFYRSSIVEGIVVKGSSTFKVVDKEKFTKINYFLHRVKYLVLGSSFYKKKGLMQIYKDYSPEVKLYHLDRLLAWYKKNHMKIITLDRSNSTPVMFGYMDQVHKRTLNMFADTKKRIEDGR